jgi:hypothetical protein
VSKQSLAGRAGSILAYRGMMPLLLRPNSNEPIRISALGIVVPGRTVRWFARLWITAVIVGSLLPGSAKVVLHASANKRTHTRAAVGTAHRFVHFFAFGSSFLVLSLLANKIREELEAALEILAIGCIVEVVQFFVYDHRQGFEWWDVRDDAIGIAVAFLLLQMARRIMLTRTLNATSI